MICPIKPKYLKFANDLNRFGMIPLVKQEDKRIRVRNFELYVQYTAANAGRPTIVFLHDSLGCTTLWRDFPAQLAQLTGCGYMVYDRRGYGRSDAGDVTPRQTNYMETEADILIALLAEMNIHRPLLFGHSDGGTIALLAAAKYPTEIAGVITEGAHVFVEEITLAGVRAAQEEYATTHLKERLAKYHGANTEWLFGAWVDTWLSPGYRNWDITHLLPGIQCPVLVIQGVDDEFGTIAQVTAIITHVSGPAEQLMIAGTGHTPHKQKAKDIATQSADFLRRHSLIQ